MSVHVKTDQNFIQDFFEYVGRVRLFTKVDWVVYVVWIGLMLGLLFSTSFFVIYGWSKGIQWPSYVWNVPIGVFIFVVAIGIDTIGHRTIYKEELQKGEALVHHITIFAGITSVVFLCLAYSFPVFLRVPTLVLIGLSIVYSLVDEAMHWRRYLTLHSDRVEMWSHFFILLGHMIMVISWWQWFDEGYQGVTELLQIL